MRLKIPRIVLAGTTSGVGKTTISCAISYGLKKLGYSVQPFKVGPDYIDPSYLSSVSGNDTINLDAWLMGKQELLKSFTRHSRSDISLIEGVMGFYDGFSGINDFGSTHHTATILQAPVILVLDASKIARSIAALALGYKKFHKNSRIKGLILNNLRSKKHELLCRQALEKLKIPIIGIVQNQPELKMGSRHLGLIPIKEQKFLGKKIENIARKLHDSIDIEKVILFSKNTPEIPKISAEKIKKSQTIIAVALDNSFNFYYKDNLEALRREGAKLKFFSPLCDKKIPNCAGIYIGGGFPEILGKSLEKNNKIVRKIKNLAQRELPLYAECGGLMYLTKIIDYGDQKYKMVGLFDAETIMTKKMTLNYTKGKVISDCLISSQSSNLRGHEFHYSKIMGLPSDTKFCYKLSIGDGIENNKDGLILHNTLASYAHLYFDSSNYAKKFVFNCLKFSKR